MASLNTLRTKFGWVLSIIIGVALLAFIVTLDDSILSSGRDPKVGSIDGDKIKYSDYMEAYDRVKSQSNAPENDEQQMDQISDMAWNSLIAQHVYIPGFERMGLRVSEAERAGIINGEYFSPVMASAFTNRQTGLYDVDYINEFLLQARTNPELQYAWSSLIDGAVQERKATKYGQLVEAGVFVNRLDIAYGLATTGKTFDGQWVGKRFADMPDSLYTVAQSDVKSYYNAHKARYKQLPSRTVSYVVFEVAASDADRSELEKTVHEVGAKFAESDNLKAFIADNRYGKIAQNYVTAGQLADDMAEALAAGTVYGPVLKNDEWTMARVVETKMLPDSLGLRHIVLPLGEDQLADSLQTALRGGADFAAMAREHSYYQQSAVNGGDTGMMPFSALSDDMVAQLATAKQGETVKLVTGNTIQLIQPYKVGKPVRQMRLATVTYPVEASAATRRDAYNQASEFAVNGKGSVEAFDNAAAGDNLIPREAKLTQGERVLQGLTDSRELVRWAYGAKTGAVSEIFTAGGDYVVAVVTGIDDNEYMPLAKAEEAIRKTLINRKKYEQTAARMTGTTIDRIAAELGSEVTDFEGVRYNAYFVRNLGMEPRVIAAIATATETGVLSQPIRGESGTFAFVVTGITEDGEPLEPGAEKVRQQAAASQLVQGQLMGTLEQMSDVQDLRGKYF